MHTSETGSKQLLYRMARLWNAAAFLPAALRCGTRRNAILLKTCKRTIPLFYRRIQKAEIVLRLQAARLSNPGLMTGAFRRGLVKMWVLTRRHYFLLRRNIQDGNAETC